jgi:hypothetical protein
MTEILQANIFFFIASAATIVFSIMACIAMYLVIKILVSLRAIIARIEAGSDLIAEDIKGARDFVTSGGLISHLISFVARQSGGGRKTRSSKSKKELVITDKE